MDKQVAFTSLTVKAVDTAKRMIRGIATTPTPDRVQDVVEPLGAQFKNPVSLLWMHRHDSPVGTVIFGKPTAKGIPFEATFPEVAEPSQLRARIEEAWNSCVSGLIRHVSIGFRPLEYSVIEETGGLRFTKTDLFELSLVSVPAQPDASFEVVKQFDREIRAAIGSKADEPGKQPSGVSEKKSDIKSKTVKLETKEKQMSLSEKLKGFQDELKAKKAKLTELAEKSVEGGETFDEADQESFDTLKSEVEALEKHVERVEYAMTKSLEKAIPVDEKSGKSEKAADEARGKAFTPARVKATQQLDKGIAFARLARCKALSKMDGVPAYEIAKAHYGEDSPVFGILKAPIAAGTTTNSTWAAPLVGDETTVFADFVDFLRPQTILGRMGQNGIPGPTTIPFRTRLITQTTGGEGYWVGEGNAKPLTKFDFTGTTLEPLKVANIAVITMELLRDSSPSAETIVRNELAKAIAARLDIDFLDPGKAPAAGVSPASVSFGVVPIDSSGTDADAVRCDIAALLGAYAAANNPPTSGVIVMSANKAIALMGMRNALGQREFPDITMSGGILEGFPVITSQYLADFGDSTGEFVFMINASDIYVGDEGGISVDMSDQASVQMDSTPDNPTGASTVLVSLWQRNLVGFRAERTINWAKRRASAVAVLGEVNWTACVSS